MVSQTERLLSWMPPETEATACVCPEYGGIVDEALRKDGVRINMGYKKAPTNQSKLSQLIQFAPDIKNFYFLDARNRSSEYEKFMWEITLFTVSGKNLHDDSVDALAMLSDFIGNGIKCVSVGRRLI